MRILHLCAGALTAAHLAQAPTADAVRDRLDAYLIGYEHDLGAIVATESLTQRVDEVRDSSARLVRRGESRKLTAEIAFVGLPGESGLQGFRRVTKVDGRAVDAPGASMTDLLQTLAPADAAARLLQQSGRHNLGMRRTTNVPSLPLELLHPRHRPRFTHHVHGRERVRNVPTTVLVADETVRPTIVRTAEDHDSPSRLTAWVDDRGRLLRAEVRLLGTASSTRYFEPRVRVEFRDHAALGLLVPVEMREEFWSEAHRRGGVGEARYSDFRRFQTSARILPPQP